MDSAVPLRKEIAAGGGLSCGRAWLRPLLSPVHNRREGREELARAAGGMEAPEGL